MRAAIVAEARSWIGTPHIHQACLKGIGCDCIGLIAGVGRALGFASAEQYLASGYRCYGRSPDVALLLLACSAFLEPVTERQLGDIVLMSFARSPQHFGILSAADQVIHAYAGIGRVVEHRIDPKWSRRVVRAYRYREVE